MTEIICYGKVEDPIHCNSLKLRDSEASFSESNFSEIDKWFLLQTYRFSETPYELRRINNSDVHVYIGRRDYERHRAEMAMLLADD